MWTKTAHTIIKHRLPLIIVLALITGFMGYKLQNIQWSFDFAKTVPAHDPDMLYFQQFRQTFGEDGNIMAIGVKDSALYQEQNFRRFKYLSEELNKLSGVTNVISLPLIPKLIKDTENKKFDLEPVFEEIPQSQQALDSLFEQAANLKFYSGQLVNAENGASLILVSIDKDVLKTKARQQLVDDIVDLGEKFSDSTGMELHYAGLPFVRSVLAGKVKDELTLFLILSVLVTACFLFIFFRSWDAVVFPIILIGVMVIWVMGTLSILEFKITMLTGLIPPIIVVIGIPNSIYLLNKYHQEYSIHGNKMRALSRVIRKIGMVTLITNFTTAVGFLVLASTDIIILKEFGIVAGINILATFIVSIIFIPAVFAYLPAPNTRQLKHLSFKPLEKALGGLDMLVHNHRNFVFFVTAIIVVVSIIGTMKIYSVSYIVDDIPEESQIKKDLRFFEENFKGVMPLEIVFDTGKKRGALNLKNLRKVEEFEDFLSEQAYVSKPISMVSFVKAAKQAFYKNKPNYYALPNNQEKNFLFRYLKGQNDTSGLVESFVDSTSQRMRISLKVADVGSNKLDSLVTQVIQPKASEIFTAENQKIFITGTTLLFVKGNKFLIENLRFSLILAFIIIAIIMGILFVNVRMILISLIPNVIPLLITAGLMGYFGIPLKPSTALIFSIAFGISVDDSIHFLAKYRQELFANNFFVPIAITKSIRETGASMMYTSIVLFFGFVIFAGSEFGGTVALGILTSTTLLIAMFTNLILLPSLLMTFDDGKRNKNFHPLIEQIDEFYDEGEDEEIDLELLQVAKGGNGVDVQPADTQTQEEK